jgi:uncharacterized protein
MAEPPGDRLISLERDQHLFSSGPKRILALDGGGTRGIISIAFLERLEALLRARHPDRPGLRLSDYFDVIGGTSTGAIIAAGLALGMEVAKVKRIYTELAPRVFRRSAWRAWALQARFSDAPLLALLRDHLGHRTMDSPDIKTGLAILTKRLDTGSPWVVSNSPGAMYWDNPPGRGFTGNRHYDLATLVRASTAAPFFFRPERIAVMPGEPHGLFIDGGVSPHNNPALMLLMLATMKAYGLCWQLGSHKLFMASVGTGEFRIRLGPGALLTRTALGLAGHALTGLISDGQLMTLTMMQWLSEGRTPWAVNSEVGDLRGEILGGVPLLAFERFNVRMEEAALQAAGEVVATRDLARLRNMTRVASMDENYRIATRAARLQLTEERLPPEFDLPPCHTKAIDTQS